MKTLAILLATTLAASAWQGRTFDPIAGPGIEGTWGKWSGVKHVPIADVPSLVNGLYGNGAAPTYSIITGTTQQVDIVTGETNTVDVSQVVPYGVLRESGGIESPTVAEWALWLADKTAQQQSAAEEFEAAEIERKNTPIVMDQPMEMPTLVLQSHSGGVGVGVVASDEGELVPFIYHASPVPNPSVIKARKDAAITARDERKADRTAEAQDIKGKAKGAGGWKALADEVERLAALVEAMQ